MRQLQGTAPDRLVMSCSFFHFIYARLAIYRGPASPAHGNLDLDPTKGGRSLTAGGPMPGDGPLFTPGCRGIASSDFSGRPAPVVSRAHPI